MTQYLPFYIFTIVVAIIMIVRGYNKQTMVFKTISRVLAGAPLVTVGILHILNTGVTLPKILMVLAFTFFILGDIVINEGLMFGLISFLIGHIFFISGLINIIQPQKINFIFFVGLVVIMLSGAFIYNVVHKIPDIVMKIGSIVYVIALTIPIGILYNLPVSTSTTIGFMGYMLFYASDFELAINAFVKKLKYDFEINTICYYGGLILMNAFILSI